MEAKMNNDNKINAPAKEKAILRRTVIGDDGKTYEVEEELEFPEFPDDLESLKNLLKKTD